MSEHIEDVIEHTGKSQLRERNQKYQAWEIQGEETEILNQLKQY